MRKIIILVILCLMLTAVSCSKDEGKDQNNTVIFSSASYIEYSFEDAILRADNVIVASFDRVIDTVLTNEMGDPVQRQSIVSFSIEENIYGFLNKNLIKDGHIYVNVADTPFNLCANGNGKKSEEIFKSGKYILTLGYRPLGDKGDYFGIPFYLPYDTPEEWTLHGKSINDTLIGNKIENAEDMIDYIIRIKKDQNPGYNSSWHTIIVDDKDMTIELSDFYVLVTIDLKKDYLDMHLCKCTVKEVIKGDLSEGDNIYIEFRDDNLTIGDSVYVTLNEYNTRDEIYEFLRAFRITSEYGGVYHSR